MIHAIERIEQHYGIRISVPELNALTRRCAEGEGLMETLPNGKRYHTLVAHDRVLWVIYLPAHLCSPKPKSPHGAILTVMPGKVARHQRHRDNGQMKQRLRRERRWK